MKVEVSCVKYKLVFYDCEVYEKFFCFVFIDYDTRKKCVITDVEKLKKFYTSAMQSKVIFCGYNSRHYDIYILKAILLGLNPAPISNALIKGGKGYNLVKGHKNVPLYNFDCAVGFHSLKTLEGFLGMDITETSVPFDLQRELTDQEKKEVIAYCVKDVEATITVFENSKEEFQSQIGLIEMFDLPLEYISKTKAQLGAIILNAKKPVQPRNDDWDLILPQNLELGRYEYVKDWYFSEAAKIKGAKLSTIVHGIPFEVSWGGCHASRKNLKLSSNLVNFDISSMYPATMISHQTLSRNVADANKFREIRDKRLEYKKLGDPRANVLKIAINSIFGASGSEINDLYDLRNQRLTCMYGQLWMLDLIDKLEEKFGDEVTCVMVNTDGILYQLNDMKQLSDFEKVIEEWSQRSLYEMERDDMQKLIIKDVNNYCVEMIEKGKIKQKAKGAMVKKNKPLDNDLPIVNTAVRDYLLNDVPIEKTINECNDLMQFQKMYKITNNYICAIHNGERVEHKVNRIFASTNPNDSAFYKWKQGKEEGKWDKFGGTPEHTFIDNGCVKNKPVDERLDKEWYINLAIKRVEQFTKEKYERGDK